MRYWQVSAGEGRNRDYSGVFLNYGVTLMGPGEPGDYFRNARYYETANERHVKRFAEEVKSGDAVVLKKPLSEGRWEAVAAGIVRGDYVHLPVFEDVEGWDLQHCRYVEWVEPAEGPEEMGGLVRGTLREVHNEQTKHEIEDVLRSGKKKEPGSGIPDPPGELSDEALIDGLINYGLRPRDAEDFSRAVTRIRRLVKWYRGRAGDVTVGEHETRTFLIVPLLLALGWPEQRLKIELNGIDVAFFEKPYGEDANNPIAVLESKKLGDGLSAGAIDQALVYAGRYPECRRIVVSDGCRYRLFDREGDAWRYSAYLNILKPKVAHPYEEGVGGASEVFLSLTGKR